MPESDGQVSGLLFPGEKGVFSCRFLGILVTYVDPLLGFTLSTKAVADRPTEDQSLFHGQIRTRSWQTISQF
jgi:hypothetical protein